MTIIPGSSVFQGLEGENIVLPAVKNCVSIDSGFVFFFFDFPRPSVLSMERFSSSCKRFAYSSSVYNKM